MPDGGRVLDAGCGHGEPVLRRVCERATGVGVDISATQFRPAAENAPAALARADMTRLPFETETFGAVTACYSLIHVPEGEHRTVLEECPRVLVPGGRLLVVEGTDEWHIAGPAATWQLFGAKLEGE